MNRTLLAFAVAGACVFGAPANVVAQDFTPWTSTVEGSEAVAETSAASEESGDFEWTFRVTRSTGGGAVSIDSLTFEMQMRNHADEFGSGYLRMDKRKVASRISLTTNAGEVFRPAMATFRKIDDSAVAIDMDFNDGSDDGRSLDPTERNCQVLSALRRASSFTVSVPEPDGTTSTYQFTGRGSTRALGAVGGC